LEASLFAPCHKAENVIYGAQSLRIIAGRFCLRRQCKKNIRPARIATDFGFKDKGGADNAACEMECGGLKFSGRHFSSFIFNLGSVERA
jgi:hypothetical protein